MISPVVDINLRGNNVGVAELADDELGSLRNNRNLSVTFLLH